MTISNALKRGAIRLIGLRESFPWSDRFSQRRLFIDCGSNVGQGFSFFRKLYPISLYDYLLIEPNPNCFAELSKKYASMAHVTLIQAAVWTSNCELNLFGLTEGDMGQCSVGGSVRDLHNTSFYQPDKATALTVKAIDFIELVKQRQKDYSSIVIKMDIESAEYEVLPALIEAGVLRNVGHLYIEFHSEFMSEPEKTRHIEKERELKSKLRAARVNFTVWF